MMMAVDNPGESIPEIAQKMPAIRDLDGVRSAGPDAVGSEPVHELVESNESVVIQGVSAKEAKDVEA